MTDAEALAENHEIPPAPATLGTLPAFEPWPKTPRLRRDCVITEKLDGTNAQVLVPDDPNAPLLFGSRTRWLTPGSDNYGFCRWGTDREAALRALLGPGRHHGEWWGVGINRAYGMRERRFSLFNVAKWAPLVGVADVETLGVYVVPTLYSGPFGDLHVDAALTDLRVNGSRAVPYMDPEGIVVFHTASRTLFKVTLDRDEEPKGRAP